jgi:membrane-associated phospholipid phosphatase
MKVELNNSGKKNVLRKYQLVLFFVLSFLTVWTLEFAKNNNVSQLDLFATNVVMHHPLIDRIFSAITELGSKYGIGTLLLVSLLWLIIKKKDYVGSVLLIVGVVGGNALNKWLKVFIGRERPIVDPTVDGEGYSFPSGHAMVGLIFYAFMFFLIQQNTNWFKGRTSIALVSVLIFLIGYSRVYLEVHYMTDVLGGFFLGGIFLITMINSYFLFIKKRKIKM